jgi:hypothetical protein
VPVEEFELDAKHVVGGRPRIEPRRSCTARARSRSEYDRGEACTAEPLREWGEAAGFDGADAVGHHHSWIRPIPVREVQPGF